MSARRQIIAALSEDSLGGIATLQDVDRATALVDAVVAEALRHAADLAEQRTGSRAEQRVLLDFATQLRRAANKCDAVRPDNLAMLPDAGFFEVGRTYEYRGDRFRVLALDPHPTRGELTAIGWIVEPDGTCLTFRMTAPDWETGKWTEVAS